MKNGKIITKNIQFHNILRFLADGKISLQKLESDSIAQHNPEYTSLKSTYIIGKS